MQAARNHATIITLNQIKIFMLKHVRSSECVNYAFSVYGESFTIHYTVSRLSVQLHLTHTSHLRRALTHCSISINKTSFTRTHCALHQDTHYSLRCTLNLDTIKANS